MNEEKTVLRKLLPSNGIDPLTVKFCKQYYRPVLYERAADGTHYVEIEALATNNFADEDPYASREGYDKAEYYICKKCDGGENYVGMEYIAVPNRIKVKASRGRERERDR